MRIVDAEPELVQELLEETQVSETRARSNFTVHVGHHPTMGKVAIVEGKNGQGVVVELE
jgi:hypothetical protein